MNDFQERLYIIFAAIFIASLVACNLIFKKFFNIDFFGYPFIQSVGLIAYPITFIVTDLISELYGKKRANQVVVAGFCASVFTVLLVYISINIPILEPGSDPILEPGSPVSQDTFEAVFGLAGPAFFASMVAYLTAQFIDVRIFHFWKKLTNGKHLWLRNNGSTIASQLVDTTLVICILFIGVWDSSQLVSAIIDGWLFKMLMAFIDTPIIYGIIHLLKGKIDIAIVEE